jgi:hypothetical protein
MVVAHWNDGSETVILYGVAVDFSDETDNVLDVNEEPIARFPTRACSFSYRPAAKSPISLELERQKIEGRLGIEPRRSPV